MDATAPSARVAVAEQPESVAKLTAQDLAERGESREPLLREALGETLRDIRSRSGQTLRELSENAAISPGYLSELERGRKEVSSELLASVCAALGVTVSDLMMEAATAMALHSASPELAAM
ncbi:helix-turn-helix transcriptional regulator [Corynebacterium amycolatum]|nr:MULTISPECIES: helix-turn-helix transcriptional regulator [Corynebacterium]MDK8819480.1 helix-turn-helix transcriptional regulator [Corynebacterium amycolatum]